MGPNAVTFLKKWSAANFLFCPPDTFRDFRIPEAPKRRRPPAAPSFLVTKMEPKCSTYALEFLHFLARDENENGVYENQKTFKTFVLTHKNLHKAFKSRQKAIKNNKKPSKNYQKLWKL